jgi:hypothetical protein
MGKRALASFTAIRPSLWPHLKTDCSGSLFVRAKLMLTLANLEPQPESGERNRKDSPAEETERL